MRRLLHYWTEVAKQVQTASSIALFLDFDGTLAWIADKPSHASLPAETRRTLECLAANPEIRISIISARDYASLRRLVDIPGIRCLGLYGWQNGVGVRLSPLMQRTLAEARSQAQEGIAGIAGVWIEDKELTFAIHFRGAGRDAVRNARSIVNHVIGNSGGVLRVMRGKKAWDVLPSIVLGKGAAVDRELAADPAALAVYVGDDVSDESGFHAVEGRGISIHVGSRRTTSACFCLRDPGEVCQFLQKLEGELSRAHKEAAL